MKTFLEFMEEQDNQFVNEGYRQVKDDILNKCLAYGNFEQRVKNVLAKHKELKDKHKLNPEHINIDVLNKEGGLLHIERIVDMYLKNQMRSKTDILNDLKHQIVYESDRYIVYQIFTYEEVVTLTCGKTNWCISSRASQKGAKDFRRYSQNCNFYIAKSKNLDSVKHLRYIAIQIFDDKVVCTDACNEELDGNILQKLGINVERFKVLKYD